MLQLKKFPTYPSPLERKHESPTPLQRSPDSASYLERRDPFPAWSGKNSRRSRRISRGGALHRKGERISGSCHHSQSPKMSQSIPGNHVFPALPRLSSRGSTHTTVARGTALWVSLVGKPRGSHRSLDPREGKRDTAATAREEIAGACPHWRRGLTPLGRLQKYPKIHVITAEESSGSGTDCTQGLRPRHRRERNPERPRATRMGTGLS